MAPVYLTTTSSCQPDAWYAVKLLVMIQTGWQLPICPCYHLNHHDPDPTSFNIINFNKTHFASNIICESIPSWNGCLTFISHYDIQKISKYYLHQCWDIIKLTTSFPYSCSIVTALWTLTNCGLVTPYAIWWHRSWPSWAQVLACCLMVPSHYLNQCWCTIKGGLWFLPASNYTRSAHEIYPLQVFKITLLKATATSPRGQWVKWSQNHEPRKPMQAALPFLQWTSINVQADITSWSESHHVLSSDSERTVPQIRSQWSHIPMTALTLR